MSTNVVHLDWDWDDINEVEERIEVLRLEEARAYKEFQHAMDEASKTSAELDHVERLREAAEDNDDEEGVHRAQVLEDELRQERDHLIDRAHTAERHAAAASHQIHYLQGLLHAVDYWRHRSRHEQQRIVDAIEALTTETARLNLRHHRHTTAELHTMHQQTVELGTQLTGELPAVINAPTRANDVRSSDALHAVSGIFRFLAHLGVLAQRTDGMIVGSLQAHSHELHHLMNLLPLDLQWAA